MGSVKSLVTLHLKSGEDKNECMHASAQVASSTIISSKTFCLGNGVTHGELVFPPQLT